MPSHPSPSNLHPTTAAGRAGLDAMLADPGGALIAFDFDGTLSPIVDDPALARAQPGAAEALTRLGACFGQVAIITGRPAGTAVDLAGLADIPRLDRLVVLGQYGLERWEARSRRVVHPAPTPGLALVRQELPAVLRAAGVFDADVEDKGLAVAVHVRRSAAPDASFARLVEPLTGLARRADLAVEPGRLVIELRPRGMDKGQALLALADEVGARSLMFTGDDLGDLAAFDAVEAWRAAGGAGLLVCSGSDEVGALAGRADVVVDGPPGVLALVEALLSLIGARRSDGPR